MSIAILDWKSREKLKEHIFQYEYVALQGAQGVGGQAF